MGRRHLAEFLCATLLEGLKRRDIEPSLSHLPEQFIGRESNVANVSQSEALVQDGSATQCVRIYLAPAVVGHCQLSKRGRRPNYHPC